MCANCYFFNSNICTVKFLGNEGVLEIAKKELKELIVIEKKLKFLVNLK